MSYGQGSVNAHEVESFSKLAAKWWDEAGAYKLLHQLNPVRLSFIRETLTQHFALNRNQMPQLQDLEILDIGCGGGLITEPLTRLGAKVTGIDASAESIAVANAHAETMGLAIDYRHTTAEALVDTGKRYDVVLALEIIEHVADVPGFLESCCKLLSRQGILIFSTLNRTLKSWALAIVAAEYVLGWVPRGTHSWQQFLTPAEIANGLRESGFILQQVQGLTYSPWSGQWQLTSDTTINYFLTAVHHE
ncbi:MAG: bifunctional 2-polyprenyl-6-hydroxyphenol methylase/3-demethylubiquinol 3-O-methyltransferase UbiG [Alphaproteobacteria bacterium]